MREQIKNTYLSDRLLLLLALLLGRLSSESLKDTGVSSSGGEGGFLGVTLASALLASVLLAILANGGRRASAGGSDRNVGAALGGVVGSLGGLPLDSLSGSDVVPVLSNNVRRTNQLPNRLQARERARRSFGKLELTFLSSADMWDQVSAILRRTSE